jgi:ribosome-associated translation inhibitor RaiA
MHIEVIGDDSSNAQARTYAEYRLFAALASHTQAVRDARIALTRLGPDGGAQGVVCEVTVALLPSGTVRTRARGGHAYAAINRALTRVPPLMARRSALRRTS